MKSSLLALGCLFAMAANSQDGTLDNTFGTTGKAYSNYASDFGSETPVVVQPDGKIIQLSGGTSGSLYQSTLIRYTSTGALDNTFGTAGKFTTSYTTNNTANTLALQPDGKIVIAGLLDSASVTYMFIGRVTAAGANDAAFGTNGRTIVPLSAGESGAFSIAVQADGKIVAGGYATDASGQAVYFGIARVNANGTLDNTFDNDGYAITQVGLGFDYIEDIVIQTDGKIVAAGLSATATAGNFGLARYNTNGSLDATFGSGGKVVTSIGSATGGAAYSVALQPDGKIVASGSTDNGTDYDFALIRYTAAGVPDATFGTAGKVITPIGNDDDEAYSVEVQTDGKIVAGGDALASNYDIALARYTTAGALDATFGTAGKTVINMTGTTDDEYGMIASQGTKIIVGVLHYPSSTTETAALIRLNNSVAFYVPGACTAVTPVVTAGGTTTFCSGGSVTLTSNVTTGIQWYNNGTAISGATSSTYQATASGSYTATSTAGTCTSPASNAIAVTVTAGPATPSITINGNVLTSSSASGNQWYRDGNIINGATAQTYTATASGAYTVRVTSGSCTSAVSNSINYTVTAINNPVMDIQVQTLPNPVTNKLIVRFGGAATRLALELTDLGGRVISRVNFISNYELDMSKLSAGSYVVRVVNQRTGEKVQRLIVKQ